MEITADTSALIAVIGNEPSRAKILELTAGCQVVAPGFVHWEIGNALSAMVKRKRITLAQAQACIEAYQQMPIKRVNVDLKQSLALVSRLQLYAYDAYLLVCAAQTGSALLTLDEALRVAALSIGIEVLEV